MARISAITNDGKEQSKAEGNLKSVLKMASLIAGNNHQIIINKNELDGFVTESKLEICTLLPQEIIEKYKNQVPAEFVQIWQEDGLR